MEKLGEAFAQQWLSTGQIKNHPNKYYGYRNNCNTRYYYEYGLEIIFPYLLVSDNFNYTYIRVFEGIPKAFYKKWACLWLQTRELGRSPRLRDDIRQEM